MLVLAHQKETMEGSQPPWRKSYVAKAICRYIVEACCDTKHKEQTCLRTVPCNLHSTQFGHSSFQVDFMQHGWTPQPAYRALPGKLGFTLCKHKHSSVCWCFWDSGTFAEEQGTEAEYSKTQSHTPWQPCPGVQTPSRLPYHSPLGFSSCGALFHP